MKATATDAGRSSWRNGTLLLASTLTVMAGATIAPSLPGMERHFADIPNVHLWVQMVMTVPGLVIALAAPLVGWVIDRWRKKWMLIIATAIYAVSGTAGLWLEDSLMALFISRLFLGVAVAGIMVTCTTLIADYFGGAQRGRYMGLLAAFGAFGGVVFVALAAWLATIDWQKPFLVYLLALLLLPFLALFINEPRKAQAVAENTQAGPESSGVGVPGLLLAAFFALAFVEILVLYMVPVHLPFYLRDLGVEQPLIAGMALAWMLLVMAGVSVAYRALQKFQSALVLHSLGFAILAMGCIYTGLAHSVWQIFLALTISGIGLGVVRPNIVVWLMANIPPQVRGRVMGGLTSSFFIGQFFCPLITLPAVQQWGYGSVFIATGVILFALALLLWGVSLFVNTSVAALAMRRSS